MALASHQKHKSFNVVLCPSHVSKKWVREIQETLPDTFAMVVKSLEDVDKLYKTYQKENKTAYLIVSKESARDGYMKRPVVNWSNSRKCFVCPDCGERQEMKLTEDGVSYTVSADHYHYKRENDKNHKCDNCGSVLWTAINPNDYNPKRNQWVKIGGYGFVHRKFARRHFEKIFDKKLIKKIAEVEDIAETFKKMAIIKTDTEDEENLDDYMIIPDEPVRNIISKPIKSPIVRNTQTDKIKVSDKVRKSVELVVAASAKSKSKKSNNHVENQITLFDLIA